MGRNPACQYAVQDKTTISSRHAMILHSAGRWMIRDLNSTNKTYVNMIAVLPGADVELFSGVGIRLADEDFEFTIL